VSAASLCTGEWLDRGRKSADLVSGSWLNSSCRQAMATSRGWHTGHQLEPLQLVTEAIRNDWPRESPLELADLARQMTAGKPHGVVERRVAPSPIDGRRPDLPRSRPRGEEPGDLNVGDVVEIGHVRRLGHPVLIVRCGRRDDRDAEQICGRDKGAVRAYLHKFEAALGGSAAQNRRSGAAAAVTGLSFQGQIDLDHDGSGCS
jgi:hypothetical protein